MNLFDTTPDKPPELEIKYGDGWTGATVTTESWVKLNKWGCYEHPYWHRAVEQGQHHRMSEVDILKNLAAVLLHQNVELEKRLLELARLQPIPPIFVPNTKEE